MKKISFILIVVLAVFVIIGCTPAKESNPSASSEATKESTVETPTPSPSETLEGLAALQNMDTHVDIATSMPSEKRAQLDANNETIFGSFFEIYPQLEDAPNMDEIMESLQTFIDYAANITVGEGTDQEKADQINELIGIWNEKQEEWIAGNK